MARLLLQNERGNEMSDQKVLAQNKIYQKLTDLLRRHNFHLYRPQVHRDAIVVDVMMDERNGRERTVTFNVPRTIHSFDYLKYADGITRDFEQLLQTGHRPPRSQFERPVSNVVALPPLPLPPNPPAKPARAAPAEGQGEPAEAWVRVVLDVPKRALQTLLDVTEGTATFVNATPIAPAGGGRKTETSTVSGFVRTMLVSFPGEFKAKELAAKVCEARPGVERDQVNQVLVSLHRQGEIRRVKWGVYAKA